MSGVSHAECRRFEPVHPLSSRQRRDDRPWLEAEGGSASGYKAETIDPTTRPATTHPGTRCRRANARWGWFRKAFIHHELRITPSPLEQVPKSIS